MLFTSPRPSSSPIRAAFANCCSWVSRSAAAVRIIFLLSFTSINADLDADLEARGDLDAARAAATFFVVLSDSFAFFLVERFPAGADLAVRRVFPMVLQKKVKKDE